MVNILSLKGISCRYLKLLRGIVSVRFQCQKLHCKARKRFCALFGLHSVSHGEQLHINSYNLDKHIFKTWKKWIVIISIYLQNIVYPKKEPDLPLKKKLSRLKKYQQGKYISSIQENR